MLTCRKALAPANPLTRPSFRATFASTPYASLVATLANVLVTTPAVSTVRIVRIPERQTDLEELVNGPPVSAAFKPAAVTSRASATWAG